MKRLPTRSSKDVFEFDEGDVEPFKAKRSKFFETFSKKNQCIKVQGDDDRSDCKLQTQKQTDRSQNRNVIAKQRKAKPSSSSSDTIETDGSDSESNQARRQLDMRFGGADGVSSSGVSSSEVHPSATFASYVVDGSREIVMHGEELCFLDGKYQSPVFVFTADTIELKLQGLGAIRWPLLDIQQFRSGLDEKGCPFIELELSENGVEILQQVLGRSDDLFCHTIYSTMADVDSWAEYIKQITSLCDGYKSVWKPGNMIARGSFEKSVSNIFDDRDCYGEHLLGHRNMMDRNRAILDNWCDLLYPTEDDRDAVTVTRYDFLLLDPDEFLSDTIIDFYIKYLQNHIPEPDRARFYFYNSFFFRKLTEINKNISDGLDRRKSSFERVKRWTAGIDIFDKDYLFIPVMQNAHWSLVIICHPGYFSAGAGDSKPIVILHLDSMEGGHTYVKEPIQSYLMQAWRERIGECEDSERVSNLKFVALKVPQQTNYTDCGLFLLHYVELFIKEVLEKGSTDFVSRFRFLQAHQ